MFVTLGVSPVRKEKESVLAGFLKKIILF